MKAREGRMNCLRLAGVIWMFSLFSPPASADDWYQTGKSADDSKRELAACKSEALRSATGAAPGTQAGVADSHRQKQIVKLCMEARGYSYGTPPDPSPTAAPPVRSLSSQVDAFAARSMEDPPGLKDGFRNLRWGDPVPTGMVPLVSKTYQEYSRSEDPLGVGPVQAESIRYRFANGRFFMAVIVLPESQLGVLKTFLQSTWGDCQSMQGNSSGCFWYARHAGADDTMALLQRSASQKALLIIANWKTSEEVRRRMEAETNGL